MMLSRLRSALSSVRLHAGALFLLYVLLLVEYVRFVGANYFQLMGFDVRVSPLPVFVGFLMLVFLFLALFHYNRASHRQYALALIVTVLFCVPQIIMFQVGHSTIFGPLYSLLFLLLLLLPCGRRLVVPYKVPSRFLVWLLPAAVVLAMVPFFVTYGLPRDLSVLSLSQHTYDVRAHAVAQGNISTNYLKGPLVNVLIPLLLVAGLSIQKKRWILPLVAVLALSYLFFVSPQKSILFSIIVVLMSYPFRNCATKAGVFLYGLLLACVGSVALNLLTGNMLAESIVVRRLFFIPVLVCDQYFAFFQGHPMLLSHSFLSHFFAYPYALDPSHLIGYMMYDRTITSCNTGIVADGFMNFGHLGAFLFVLLGAAVLRFVDAVDYDSRYFGLVVLLLFSFLNGALFTALLTHGGLALILSVLFVIPSNGPTCNNNRLLS